MNSFNVRVRRARLDADGTVRYDDGGVAYSRRPGYSYSSMRGHTVTTREGEIFFRHVAYEYDPVADEWIAFTWRTKK